MKDWNQDLEEMNNPPDHACLELLIRNIPISKKVLCIISCKLYKTEHKLVAIQCPFIVNQLTTKNNHITRVGDKNPKNQ